MHETIIAKAGEIIAKNTTGGEAYQNQHCVLALIDDEGRPTASAITAARAEGIRWITFCTGLGSNKAKRISECSRSSVCFASSDYNITLAGDIEILTDPEIKKEMWYAGLEGHFSGPDDPNYCVLKFTTKRYNLLIDWQETAGRL